MITRREALRWLLSTGAACLAAGCSSSRSKSPTLWYSYGGKNREVLLSLVSRFNETHPTPLTPIYQGDYFESLAKLRTALYAGVAPTLTHVVGEVLPYLAAADVLSPLSELETAARDLVPTLAQRGGFSGDVPSELLAIPFNRSTPVALLNANIARALELSPPETWSSLRAFAQRATERSGEGPPLRWGFACPVDWWFWAALVGQAGGSIMDTRGAPRLDAPAAQAAVEFFRTLVQVDVTMKPPTGRDYNAWQVINSEFLAGRIAMIWTSTAFLRYLEENASFPIVAAPLPVGTRAAVPTGGTFWIVPRATPPEHRQIAIQFLEWMLKPEQAAEWADRTGYLPVTRGGVDLLTARGFFEKHPNDHVTQLQLSSVMPWPWSPELFRIQREVVQPRLEAAVVSSDSIGAMMLEAQRVASRGTFR